MKTKNFKNWHEIDDNCACNAVFSHIYNETGIDMISHTVEAIIPVNEFNTLIMNSNWELIQIFKIGTNKIKEYIKTGKK